MVHNTVVKLATDATRTRLLVTQGTTDIGKVVLPGGLYAHPRAMPTLLEGLALFVGERLCVVLSVDERSGSSCGLGLLDGMGCGERSVFYDVAIAASVGHTDRRRAARALRVPGCSFRDLSRLVPEAGR